MKLRLRIAMLIIIGLALFSCSKEDQPKPLIETPIVAQTTSPIDDQSKQDLTGYWSLDSVHIDIFMFDRTGSGNYLDVVGDTMFYVSPIQCLTKWTYFQGETEERYCVDNQGNEFMLTIIELSDTYLKLNRLDYITGKEQNLYYSK